MIIDSLRKDNAKEKDASSERFEQIMEEEELGSNDIESIVDGGRTVSTGTSPPPQDMSTQVILISR